MKMKIGLIVVALSAAPSFAFAMGCSKGEDKITASSCAAGMVWDAAKETCVSPAST